MELKNFQKRVIADLQTYIESLYDADALSDGYINYWEAKQIPVSLIDGVPPYHDVLPGVPHVCYKVPTGGGKTFLGCSSLKVIFDDLPQGRPRVAVWLVPSDAILTQTLKALKNPQHPYRQKLNVDFNGRVEVYSKEELLVGQNFSPSTVSEQLTIMVLSYDSFRAKNKEGRKAYKENGYLEAFRGKLAPSDNPIENADDTALFQVINQLNPVVVVDESHHATTQLSIEMLTNFNPSFVLELTATPHKNANVISYVDAFSLKAENMVKLPVVVFNRNNQAEVISNAIDLRNQLQAIASKEEESTGIHIRPIVLFQAEPKTNEKATSFEKLKQKLIEVGIPENEVAIKTAAIDELKNIDLMDRSCKINYIITVNALNEGWDCPFAYILASLANKTSQVDVEQILGRVLRQPYTQRHASDLLNMSYVLTSSQDFQHTVDSVVSGLNSAGFTSKDYRIADVVSANPQSSATGNNAIQPKIPLDNKCDSNQIEISDDEEFLQFDPIDVTTNTANREHSASSEISDIVSFAEEQNKAYENEAETRVSQLNRNVSLPTDLEEKVKMIKLNPSFSDEALQLHIPQFFVKEETLFGDDYDYRLLESSDLIKNFSLGSKDSSIVLEAVDNNIRAVDVRDENKEKPKAFSLNAFQQQELYKYVTSLDLEGRRNHCSKILVEILDKDDGVPHSELQRYVNHVLEALSEAQIDTVLTHTHTVANQIRQKIDKFKSEHREHNFDDLSKVNAVTVRPSYTLPKSINLFQSIDSLGLSLYETEGFIKGAERSLVEKIIAVPSVKWWHRIPERASWAFMINGFINHYPDFMVYTKRGNLLMVEYKGVQLTNNDTRQKIKLGNLWAEKAGPEFFYFLVFDDSDAPMENSYTVSKFLEILAQL